MHLTGSGKTLIARAIANETGAGQLDFWMFPPPRCSNQPFPGPSKPGFVTSQISSRKLALASWSCSCFSKLSDGVDAPQKPQIID